MAHHHNFNKRPISVTSSQSDSHINYKKFKHDYDSEDITSNDEQKCHNCANLIDEMKDILEKNQKFYMRLINGIQEENKRNFQRLAAEVQELKQDIFANIAPVEQPPVPNDEYLLPDFPITDSTMFLEFDRQLMTHENKEMLQHQARSFFMCSGGNDIPNFIRNCLRRTITDEAACEFCWSGTLEKYPVKDMIISDIIKGVCSEYFNSTDYQLMEKVIKSHFQYAKDRISKRAKTIARRSTLFE